MSGSNSELLFLSEVHMVDHMVVLLVLGLDVVVSVNVREFDVLAQGIGGLNELSVKLGSSVSSFGIPLGEVNLLSFFEFVNHLLVGGVPLGSPSSLGLVVLGDFKGFFGVPVSDEFILSVDVVLIIVLVSSVPFISKLSLHSDEFSVSGGSFGFESGSVGVLQSNQSLVTGVDLVVLLLQLFNSPLVKSVDSVTVALVPGSLVSFVLSSQSVSSSIVEFLFSSNMSNVLNVEDSVSCLDRFVVDFSESLHFSLVSDMSFVNGLFPFSSHFLVSSVDSVSSFGHPSSPFVVFLGDLFLESLFLGSGSVFELFSQFLDSKVVYKGLSFGVFSPLFSQLLDSQVVLGSLSVGR